MTTADLTTLRLWYQTPLPEAPAWIGIYGAHGEVARLEQRAPVAVALAGVAYAWDTSVARAAIGARYRQPHLLA